MGRSRESHLPPQPMERETARVVLEARHRRLRRQAVARHQIAPDQQLVDRIIGDPVPIVAVRTAARDAEHPLAAQVLKRMPKFLRRPLLPTRHRANPLTNP